MTAVLVLVLLLVFELGTPARGWCSGLVPATSTCTRTSPEHQNEQQHQHGS